MGVVTFAVNLLFHETLYFTNVFLRFLANHYRLQRAMRRRSQVQTARTCRPLSGIASFKAICFPARGSLPRRFVEVQGLPMAPPARRGGPTGTRRNIHTSDGLGSSRHGLATGHPRELS